MLQEAQVHINPLWQFPPNTFQEFVIKWRMLLSRHKWDVQCFVHSQTYWINQDQCFFLVCWNQKGSCNGLWTFSTNFSSGKLQFNVTGWSGSLSRHPFRYTTWNSLLIIRVNLLPFKNAARSPRLYPLWQFPPNPFHELAKRSPSLYPLWQFPLNNFHEFLTKKISVQSYWLVTVYSVHTNSDIQFETFSLLIVQVNFLTKFISKFLSPLATSTEHFPWIGDQGNGSSTLLAGHCLDT